MKHVGFVVIFEAWILTSSLFERMAQAQAGDSISPPTATSMEERWKGIEERLRSIERRLDRLDEHSSANADEARSPGNVLQNVSLEGRLKQLDQKLQIAEQRNGSEAASATPQPATTPVLGAGPEGFFLRSADNAFRLNLHGQLQADGRFSHDDSGHDDSGRAGADTFSLGSIRPILEGTFFRDFSFRIMPDFGRGTTFLQEAYFDATIQPWIKFRAGKYKGPVGLERLAGDSELLFFERAFPTALVPNRDVGVELYGEPWGGVLTFAAGLFDGVPDGSSADTDGDDKKEFEGRLFTHPFRKSTREALQGLGIGVSGTLGKKAGSPSSPSVASYRTSAQQTFFHYRADGTLAGTVIADGAHSRISPQAYYYGGPFGLLGEYVVSLQEVERGTFRKTLGNRAWQVAASYVLTGEKASYRSVTPAHSFDRGQGHWGAFEIAARYSELRVDPAAFPVFANPQDSSQKARAWTVGFNWYLNKNAKFVFDYEQTHFTAIPGGRNRQTEKSFLERFQIAF